MALFVARPSRGSWAFFGLVALAFAVARGYGRYERAVVRRDAPLSERAQELAACVFGADTAWILAGESPDLWEDAMSTWLRRAASVPQPARWPRDCIPVATGLVEKLRAAPNVTTELSSLADQLVSDLREASGVRATGRRVELADSERLPREFAGLFAGVRALSQGTRARWRPMPEAARRYVAAEAPTPARLRPFPGGFQRVTLTSGTTLVAFSAADGLTHQYTPAPRALLDAAVAPMVPVGDVREGVLRVEGDQGPGWMIHERPPRALSMPADFRFAGDPSLFAWDAARADDRFAIATVDDGTARLYVTTLGDVPMWAPPVTLGAPESQQAVVVAAEGEQWRVTTLRTWLSHATLVQYVVRRATVPAPTPRHGRPEALAVTEAPPTALEVSAPVVLHAAVRSFGARVSTCASGNVRYFVLASASELSVHRVEGAVVTTQTSRITWPQNYEMNLRCDARRVLVGTRPVMSVGGLWLVTFNGGRDAILPLEPPTDGPSAAVREAVLVPDGVLAFVATQGALRAWRYTQNNDTRTAGSWDVRGLVALTRTPEGLVRTFASVTAQATNDAVLLLLEGTLSPRPSRTPPPAEPATTPPQRPPEPYRALALTSDGGRSFWSP